MQNFVKEELSIVIGDHTFYESADIAFTYKGDRMIGEIVRIVPARNGKPTMLILNKLEVKPENGAKRQFLDGMRAYIVNDIFNVSYVSVG